ncbi:MAG: hypothetical protein LBJ81_01400 [Puniceicoccales bacterium]|jgi:hypothetical protein|nr:hypothetical protein [Puniceicoccales bacterium]
MKLHGLFHRSPVVQTAELQLQNMANRINGNPRHIQAAPPGGANVGGLNSNAAFDWKNVKQAKAKLIAHKGELVNPGKIHFIK